MSKLPVDVVNRIMRFVSHPTADMIKPLIITTKNGNFINFRSKLHWLFNDFEGDDDDYETHVIGRCIRNHYNVKYITEKLNFDEIYYHCNKTHILKLIEQDTLIAFAFDHLLPDDIRMYSN